MPPSYKEGFKNILSTRGARESAITTFLNSPQIIKFIPSENFSLEKDLAFSIWGIKFLARSIGPATNCGNNETKVAKLIKLFFGLSLL